MPYPLKIKSVRLLADPSVKIRHSRSGGQTHFDLPPFAPDAAVSILAVELKEMVPHQPVPDDLPELKDGVVM